MSFFGHNCQKLLHTCEDGCRVVFGVMRTKSLAREFVFHAEFAVVNQLWLRGCGFSCCCSIGGSSSISLVIGRRIAVENLFDCRVGSTLWVETVCATNQQSGGIRLGQNTNIILTFIL
jgi:hypothetical protein